MKDYFENYVTSWFHDYIVDHEEDDDLLQSLFNTICPRQDNDLLSDWIGEDETVCDYLLNCSAEDIYRELFASGAYSYFDDMPDAEKFVYNMLKKVVEEIDLYKYSFADEFIEDMAYHITKQENPSRFFDDLMQHGCASGMIGMLIYNSDCLALYCKYADDMEEFREDLEDEIGCPIKRNNAIRHYVWICWLCYEELAYRINEFLHQEEYAIA